MEGIRMALHSVYILHFKNFSAVFILKRFNKNRQFDPKFEMMIPHL